MPSRADRLVSWASANWPGQNGAALTARAIPADGSPRLFLRLSGPGGTLVAMSNPDNPPENRAWLGFAAHLGRVGAPVARVLAADLAVGHFLMEDLGETSLMQKARAAKNDSRSLLALYRPAVALAALLHARGAPGLDTSLCFDSARLDPDFLLKREAGYFLEEMVKGALGREDLPPGLSQELADICRAAGSAAPAGFTHRDFQSRNLILGPKGLGLVDFQGGRLGPAAYDLAALLWDAYVDLPPAVRQELARDYVAESKALGPFDETAFWQGLPFVAASRLMQAAGAFAFLTRKMGRAHFAAHVPAVLAGLKGLASEDDFGPFPAFRALVESLPARPAPELFNPLPGVKP